MLMLQGHCKVERLQQRKTLVFKESEPYKSDALRLRNQLSQAERAAPHDYARLRIVELPRNGTSMAYFELGAPDGKPLLCLHGLSLSGFYFEQYDSYFANAGIRAIAPCMLGSVHLSDPGKTIDDLSSELIELMDMLGVGRFDMIGFSWGTLPELALLAHVPRRIRRAGLLGPMLPVDFLSVAEQAAMKPDVRMSLRMAKSAPLLHRGLMWLVCRLPIKTLVDQFKDISLSQPEAAALQSGSPFHQRLTSCLAECIRTGSDFFTHGWRMFLDKPGYALKDLAIAAKRVELRLYVGQQDNVHLPSMAYRIAAACAGTDAALVEEQSMAAAAGGLPLGSGVLQQVYSHDACSIWMAPGAGRMACMVYFKQSLDNLMSAPRLEYPD